MTLQTPQAGASLDDVATMIVQAEPSDESSLVEIFAALRVIADSGQVAGDALAHIRSARTALERCLIGENLTPEAALTEVGQCVERAQRAHELLRESIGTPAAMIEAAVAPVAPVAPAPVAVAHEPKPLDPDADLDLLRDFVMEGREYLEKAEAALLALESEPGDSEAVNTVFRAFHTVKGTSAFLGLDDITDFAHEAESLLSLVRDGAIAYDERCADLSLRAADMLKALLEVAERAASGALLTRPAGYSALLGELQAAASGEPQAPAAAPVAVPASAPVAASVQAAMPFGEDEVIAEQPVVKVAALSPVASAAPVVPAAQTPTAAANAAAAAASEQTLRVRTDRLDRLVDMVGELVIAQSMIAEDSTVIAGGNHDLIKKVSHAGKMVRELQELSMSMRMVPLKGAFQKMVRLVRDVSHKTGKQVELVLEGEETEIDRNLVDIVGDPLVHMVRNAVDHGIETPDVREAAGKSRTGTVRLSAYHSGGNVVVELRDDGKGLDRDRIVRKAMEKGLIESDKGMTDAQVYDLVFAPGFSTADQITDVSGRGVGMDVVRRNVESARGRVEITSEKGKGSVFTIRLPLTLAITDGMLVKVGGERFIVPISSIQLSFRPERSALSTAVGRGEMVLLRDQLMPIIRLHRLFDVRDAAKDPSEALLMVVGDGTRRAALLVDELLGQQQVVAKSLGGGIAKQPGIAGGAILGDGRVGLILDVNELVTLSRTAQIAA